jgi:hypothetical protein
MPMKPIMFMKSMMSKMQIERYTESSRDNMNYLENLDTIHW